LGKPVRLWLNQVMRSHTKYRLPRPRKGRHSRFLWLLMLVGLVVAGWIWWYSGQPKAPAPKPKPVALAPTTQVVVQPKPPPVNVPPRPPLAEEPMPAPRTIAKPSPEPPPPGVYPRPVRNVFEAQLALARQGISSGSLDGVIGPQTHAALRAFQQKEHIAVTGELDATTKERLLLASPPYATYIVTTNDLARLQPLSSTWLGKSQQTALDYETILELVAEKGHAHPNLIRQLNRSTAWTNMAAGTSVQLPDVAYTDATAKAAFATISLGGKCLEAFDAKTNLLAHFPCSIAQHVEKRPVGELHVAVIAPNPNYTFDPEVFPESPEAQQLKTKLVLPPGPNNPVGVAWIGLDKPGYGMHGTPSPEQVGRTESHGCFRLANWNAEYLLKLAWVGMPVFVEP
jgi:lipoprotein-anchoring transpeptidase ErfK/SrfK